MKFNTQYDHEPGPELKDFEPSRTKQEFLEESDVNFIINQYETTGLAPLSQGQPIYGDFSAPELQSYHEAINVTLGAEQLFNRLPAKTRERFSNNVGKLLDFIDDPKNKAEAIDLGLFLPDEKPPTPGPAPAPVPEPVKP